jgi:hypothetical protein
MTRKNNVQHMKKCPSFLKPVKELSEKGLILNLKGILILTFHTFQEKKILLDFFEGFFQVVNWN